MPIARSRRPSFARERVQLVRPRPRDACAAQADPRLNDLLLCLRLTETFGNVTTEVLACTLPLVAFDLVAAAQLVRSGCNGLLARAGDERAFVDHALRVATSPVFSLHLGRCARASVLPHSWESIVGQVEGVMAEAIGRAADRSSAPDWQALHPSAG